MPNKSITAILKGYKQTDIGVIPDDWDVKRLGSVCDVRDGTHESPKYHKEGITFITSKNIINGKIDFSEISFISSQDAENINKRSKVDKNDIIMSMIGTIGNSVLIDFEPNFCIKNVALIKPENIVPEYLIQLLNSAFYLNYLFGNLDGGIQKFISLVKLRSLEVMVPSEAEQSAIAAVLSDTDALIESLEKLIAKKRAIKQGAMQELLTGKRRLPGFNGNWEVKQLGELLDYEQPTKYLVKDAEYNDNNKTPVLTAGKTFILGYTNEESGIFTNLPVIIFDDFTTANKYVNIPFKAKSSAMKMLKPKNEKVNLRFVFWKMQLIDFKLGDHKRYWISEYRNLEIYIPRPEEQTAITSILSEMDNEIEALDQKLIKYKQLRQGMMQVLLTGKIRLHTN